MLLCTQNQKQATQKMGKAKSMVATHRKPLLRETKENHIYMLKRQMLKILCCSTVKNSRFWARQQKD